MFWAIAAGAIDTREFRFERVLQDIQTLNEWALEGRLEVTATSLHAYPFVQNHYALLPHGASIGSGWAGRRRARAAVVRPASLCEIVVWPDDDGVSGPAARTRRVRAPRAPVRPDPRGVFGRAISRLVIHEGQLTYEAAGLHKVLDLGEWWLLETGLPLPRRRQPRPARPRRARAGAVGGPAGVDSGRPREPARRDALRDEVRPRHRPGHERALRRHVREQLVRLRDEGRRAVEELLRRGEAIGAFPEPVRLDYIA